MKVNELLSSVTRFEGLHLIGKLAEGPYGDLYLVEQEKTGRRYGLKFLSHQVTGSMPLSGLVDAIKDARGIDHPNVATTYDIGLIGNQAYILREYVSGNPLEVSFQRPSISLKELINITTQSVRALAAVHEKGIVHNNIKPSNIIVSEGSSIKLVDLGIGDFKRKFEYEVTHVPDKEFLVFGAPEQKKGKEFGNERADLYSLGTVIKTIGFQKAASESATSTYPAILEKIRGEYDLPPELRVGEPLGKRFGKVLDMMVARKPGNRLTAEETLVKLDLITADLDSSSGLPWRNPPSISTINGASDESKPARREVNVWLVENEPPLVVGIEHKVGVNIGQPREGSVGGGEFKEPDWGDLDKLDLIILLDGSNVTIAPGWQPTVLPKTGNMEPLYFYVTPLDKGTVLLSLSIYLARELTLLEEFLIELSAVEKVGEAAA